VVKNFIHGTGKPGLARAGQQYRKEEKKMTFADACGIVYGDRFSYTESPEPAAFAVCENEKCNIEILSGDSYIEHDGNIYHCAECLAEAIGAVEKYAPEIQG
jgi:hypothetical protein